MPFIRLSDNYIDHPKFLALSASAFRLWHEGMAFCRKHQTDGRIPSATLQGFRYFKAARVSELATPYQLGAEPLWEMVEGFGYQVHNYLFWNLSKEEEQAEKDGATARMRALRKRRRDDRLRAGDAACSPEHGGERSPNVQDRIRIGSEKAFTERESERKPDARSNRPIFTGQKLTVFEWMLDDCARTLGNCLPQFDLHAWFFDLDAACLQANFVVPKRDGGTWLQSELVAEAQRRGLPLTLPTGAPQNKRIAGLVAGGQAFLNRGQK